MLNISATSPAKAALLIVLAMRHAGSADQPRDDHGKWTHMIGQINSSGAVDSRLLVEGKSHAEIWPGSSSQGRFRFYKKSNSSPGSTNELMFDEEPNNPDDYFRIVDHVERKTGLEVKSVSHFGHRGPSRSKDYYEGKFRGLAFNEDQPRDEHGQWTSGGSSSWPSGLKNISGAQGTNPGGLYKDASGQQWYVKRYNDPRQAQTEHISNAIYRAVGVDAPESVLGEGGDYASKWQDSKGILADHLTKENADKVLDGFAADVFLDNWDAVGTGHNNVIVSGDKVSRIDQGGTLLFRAQGALKPEGGLHRIDEWDSLVEKNDYYREVFKKAGVANGNALGERAAAQIDRIVAARPAGGWKSMVDRLAPRASAGFRAKVGEVLEARQKLLEAKRDQLRGRAAGRDDQPRDDHGRWSDVGPEEGVRDDKPTDTQWKRTYKPGAKDQKHTVGKFTMYFRKGDGSSLSHEITTVDAKNKIIGSVSFGETFTGDPRKLEGSVSVHPSHRRQGMATAMYDLGEKLTKKKFIPSVTQSKRGEAFWSARLGRPHIRNGEAFRLMVAEFNEADHPRDPDGKFTDAGGAAVKAKVKAPPVSKELKDKAYAMVKSGKTFKSVAAELGMTQGQLAGHVYKVDQKKKALEEAAKKAAEAVPVAPASIASVTQVPVIGMPSELTDPASQGDAAGIAFAVHGQKWGQLTETEQLARTMNTGHVWKAKESGIKQGQYAWHDKNGVQVSSAFPLKNQHREALATIHNGVGLNSIGEKSYVGNSPAPKVSVAPAYVPPAPVADKTPGWPIDNGVVRTLGANYPSTLDKQSDSWVKGLTDKEKSAITSYAGNHYMTLNEALRKGHWTKSLHEDVTQIDSALAKSTHVPDLVWRGIPKSTAADQTKTWSKNDIVEMRGYQSTSLAPVFAKNWSEKYGPGGVVLEIKPAKGAFVRSLGIHSEHEYLLPHHGRFTVLGRKTIKMRDNFGASHTQEVIQLEMHK